MWLAIVLWFAFISIFIFFNYRFSRSHMCECCSDRGKIKYLVMNKRKILLLCPDCLERISGKCVILNVE